jgi:hypothetical protein
LRCVEPAVGVRSGDVEVFGRDNQERERRNVRERVDFFSFADAKGAATKQEKRDVGT